MAFPGQASDFDWGGAAPNWGRRKPKKSLFVAFLLLFSLGGLGAHRFYLGRTVSGFLQMSLNLGSIALFFGGNAVHDAGMFGIGVAGIGLAMIWGLADIVLVSLMVRAANR